MSTWTITGFDGVNNMQDPSAIGQPKAEKYGGSGNCELVECVNFDIDDNGGLVSRSATQEIFTKPYDSKLTQTLKGRKYTVTANRLYYTKPWSEERDPRRSMIAFPALITMIIELGVGLWVSTTNAIYYHRGTNPTELGQFAADYEYGHPAIMGTGESAPASKLGLEKDGWVAIFATNWGICVGDDNGNITNYSEAKFSYSPGRRGVSMIKEENGMIQYMVRMLDDTGESYNQQPDPQNIDIDEV